MVDNWHRMVATPPHARMITDDDGDSYMSPSWHLAGGDDESIASLLCVGRLLQSRGWAVTLTRSIIVDLGVPMTPKSPESDAHPEAPEPEPAKTVFESARDDDPGL